MCRIAAGAGEATGPAFVAPPPRAGYPRAVSARALIEASDKLDDVVLEGGNLRGLDMAGKSFYRCRFDNLSLQACRWSGARLEDCVFSRCDVTQMITTDLKIHGLELEGCKAMGIEWGAPSLSPQLSFTDCNLQYSVFIGTPLRGARFLRCKATEVQFLDLDLTDADFSESDLSGSTFSGTTLSGADFRTAQGAFLDPAKNRVKGVRIGEASAALLAASFGMKVAGLVSESKRRAR